MIKIYCKQSFEHVIAHALQPLHLKSENDGHAGVRWQTDRANITHNITINIIEQPRAIAYRLAYTYRVRHGARSIHAVRTRRRAAAQRPNAQRVHRTAIGNNAITQTQRP